MCVFCCFGLLFRRVRLALLALLLHGQRIAMEDCDANDVRIDPSRTFRCSYRPGFGHHCPPNFEHLISLFGQYEVFMLQTHPFLPTYFQQSYFLKLGQRWCCSHDNVSVPPMILMTTLGLKRYRLK